MTLNNCELPSVQQPMNTAPRRSSPRLRIAPAAPRAPQASPGVVAQVRLALRPKARLATLLGCLLGGFVPLASYVVAHGEVDLETVHGMVSLLLVLGGLLFSAKTVFAWGRMAFNHGGKALGFTVLLEGVMTMSHTHWLAFIALGYLVSVNAIATGCTLSLAGRR